MPLVGDFDPAGYVAGNFATYPPLPPGATLYQPTMWWLSIGTGVMDGAAVRPGDRIYANGRARLYGDFTYGSAVYGNPPDQDWPVEVVTWLIWDSSIPPEFQPPFPFSGCPFGDRDEFTPGQWRIVVEALFNDLVGSRTYGALLYGDDVYGDAHGEGRLLWHDVTRPTYEITLAVGTSDGAPAVPVNSIQVSVVDSDGEWFEFADPAYFYTPFVGSPLRVGFMDPEFKYWPVVVGAIEQIRDEHDTLPRYVTIQAFGNDSDLSNDVAPWQRPAEMASTRFAALMTAGGWRFGDGQLVYPGDAALHADRQPRSITVRSEIDRTVLSAGWFFDTDTWGGPRLRQWPHVPTGAPIEVTDCREDGPPGARLSHVITFTADTSQLLNVAMISNDADPVVNVRAEEELSIGPYGRRSKAMGFPLSGLAFADAASASALVVRYSNRWAFILRQVESVEADTRLDPAWMTTLAALDTGQPVHVTRTVFAPLEMDGVVVGYTHMITPNRIRAKLNVATLTETR